MVITKKHLDRRTFLRGMGATVALPLLDAMIPARALLAASAARPVPRLAFVYFPHGAIMNEWTPATPAGDQLGSDPRAARAVRGPADDRQRTRESPCLRPGARDHAGHLAVRARRPARRGGPGRTGSRPTRLAADHLGRDTPLPSMALAAEEPRIDRRRCRGQGDYGESHGTTISFRGASAPLPMEWSPRAVFDQLFVDGLYGADDAHRTRDSDERSGSRRRGCRGPSRRRLGAADRAALGDYLDSVRDVEHRVEQAEARRDGATGVTGGGGRAFAERLALMFDLIGARVPRRHHARRVVHDGGRNQLDDLRPSRRARFVPPAVASPERSGEDRAARSHPDVITRGCSQRFVRQLAEMHRRRRLDARSLADPVRQQHERQPRARSLPVAAGGDWRRLRRARAVASICATPTARRYRTCSSRCSRRAGVPVTSFGDSTGECTAI